MNLGAALKEKRLADAWDKKGLSVVKLACKIIRRQKKKFDSGGCSA